MLYMKTVYTEYVISFKNRIQSEVQTSLKMLLYSEYKRYLLILLRVTGA